MGALIIRYTVLFAGMAIAALALPGCETMVDVLANHTLPAMLDDSSDNAETRITGYCRNIAQDSAYALYSSSSYEPECAPGDTSITRAEFETIESRQRTDWARDYCDDGNRPYRATGDDCDPGDTAIDKADWLALSRGHATREVL